MKTILLVCTSIILSMCVYGQSDSSGNNINKNNNTNLDINSSDKVNSDSDMNRSQNQDLDHNTNTGVKVNRMGKDSHSMGDSSTMHRGQHKNMPDTIHVMKPV